MSDKPELKLRDLMQSGYETARKIVLTGQEAVPVFIAQWGDGNVAIYATPWGSEEEKGRILTILRVLFAARNVQQYALISEVWAVERKSLEEIGERMPSECEDRRERLMILGVASDKILAAFADLGHGQDNSRTCGPLTWINDADKFGGRMAELLPDPAWGLPPPGTAEMLEAKFGIKPEAFTSVH